jgi:hypothetical protein
MLKKYCLIIVSIFVILTCTVSAVDFSGWKEITVDESLVNSSSNTTFTVMLPPGHTNQTIDAPIGPVTSFLNETNKDSIITIVVMDNPIGQKLNDKNSKMYLDNFMLGANVTPIADTEPKFLDDGGIMDYGTNGDETAGVYILSTDEKVIVVTGFYKNMDDASSGIENLAMIAGTIEIVKPEI